MKHNRHLTNLFESATLRLTGWYLLILLGVSLVFSVAIYQVASHEVQTRLERFQTRIQDVINTPPAPMMGSTLRSNELGLATNNLATELVYINIIVLVAGGFGSYFLARRNLAPIKRAHEAQSRFTSDASHELRTPLAVMKTELEVALRDDEATKSSLREVLSSNLEEVEKLTKLSEMLLSLSRLDNARLPMKVINLDKVTVDVVNSFGKSTKRIQTNITSGIKVNGNETALSDLIKVLIDNALQYSPENSKITVNVTKDDCNGIVTVRNNGDGIAEDKLPFIFDRFYRADSSRNKKHEKGFGLGLALAKSIAELHDGEIIASSTPGGETVFTLKIPLVENLQEKVKK